VTTAVPSQKTPDFLDALDKCIQFLGGVPRCIVPDNLKSAVIKSDRYEPEINRCMEDLANHYGTVIIPARAGKPRGQECRRKPCKDHLYTGICQTSKQELFLIIIPQQRD